MNYQDAMKMLSDLLQNKSAMLFDKTNFEVVRIKIKPGLYQVWVELHFQTGVMSLRFEGNARDSMQFVRRVETYGID